MALRISSPARALRGLHNLPRRKAPSSKAAVTTASADAQQPVLVVGATGRVGQLVCEELAKRGVQTRAMARDPAGAAAARLSALPGTTVVEGNLVTMGEGELAELLRGCGSCISVSGTQRPTKFSDLWVPPQGDAKHPYEVSYLGTKKLAAAAKATGCARVVKITSRSTAKSPFNPFVVIFNLLGSMTMKWQREAERALRDSGVPYTIVRPGAISDETRDPSANHLVLTSRGEKAVGEIKVGKADVARLMVDAASHPAAANTSLTCLWGKGAEGAQEWTPLLEGAQADDEPLSELPHELGVAAYCLGAGGVVSLAFRAAFGG
eukprot:CAMPEP_0182883958 /NCGR_PEP_ID=MMETSP0034_2-20130328/18696_1 /TAXON_ID=156128 /ORGANISM="Nephroselmis pyriformis, Strain CCMP717" /LENGTH=321 /DNA_ID=CAMNT_0025017121 /DNA_START=13 /DNA_END=978 /DNA_ORIENTATION=+